MKIKEILLELNVVNTKSIDAFVSQYNFKSLLMKLWFQKQVRNWLLNNKELTRPYKSELNEPEWIQKAIDRGEKLVEIDITSIIKNQLNHIIDWLNWLTEQDNIEAKRILQKLSKLTVPMAIQKSEQWTEWLNKQSTNIEDEEGLEVIMKFKDGYRIVKLLSKQCYDREGKLMQHCVGSYYDEVKTNDIYSLRDLQNQPYATIEIKSKKINQIRGKQNELPIEKYWPYIRKFISKFNFDIKGDLNNTGLIKSNDKIYDIFKLPNNLKINDNLDLSSTKITQLPKNLKVNGYLYLHNTPIIQLPDNLEVGSDLTLHTTKITQLPKNLKVGRDLYLGDLKITQLPKNLKVGHKIYR